VLLRAVRAQLLPSLATLLLAFVVSAGAVGVVGASRVGQTPGAVAAMLALYGAVALAEQSARTVVDRSHDVALARLRGLTGARLVLFAAGPLLAVSLTGCVLGSVVGTWLARRITDGWSISYSLGAREVVVAVAIVVGSWITIVLVATAVIRRPLADALSVHPRRRGAPWITTFLELLVVMGACLAVYEAHRSEQSWVPTIAPALVALAAGQVVMWVLSVTPRLGRRLGAALTSRRLRRDPDPGSAVRVLVAAAVLLAVTLTGGRAAAEWRNDAGRLRAGGPLAVPFADGGLRAYAAAHDADPQGRWLMAATYVDDPTSVSDRRVYVDAHRWSAVVGDFVDSTSAGSATSLMDRLGNQTGPALLRGDSLQVDVTALGAGHGGVVSLDYLSDKGYIQTARVHVDHPGAATGDLRACVVGCTALRVTLRGDAFDVGSVTAGRTKLVGATSYAGGKAQRVLSVSAGDSQIPALITPGLRISSEVEGVDGTSRAVKVIGTVGAVPFVGRTGALLDLGQVLRGTVGTVASARSLVVARADTPAGVLAELKRDGGGTPSTYAAAATQLDRTPEARGDRLALLVAIGVGLVALTHLFAWLSGQLGRRRAEVAGLRVAGIRPGAVRRAYLLEAGVLAGIVFVAAAATSAATTVPLLKPMQLAGGWAEAPRLSLGVRPVTLIGVVLGIAALTALLCAVAFTRFGRDARPSALRSADR
jgi:hypothetical protein